MALSAEDQAFAFELFAGLEEITIRRAMAGVSIYNRGQIFAMMMSDGRIRIKARGPLAEALAAEGAERFCYSRKDGKVIATCYWTLPEAALDDPEMAADWGRRALAEGADAPAPGSSRRRRSGRG